MSKPPPCTDVSTHTCVTEPCTCVWLPGLSDTELKFEDNNKVVCRNKNDGCYPASTSSWQPQPSGQSTFAVRVDHYATRPINSLTIGEFVGRMAGFCNGVQGECLHEST
eukprot:m.131358 g.131358  ORF g.131358 m.131358 type:complete len:109 (-) comp16815_c0_seq2:274-600(-)